MNDHSNDTRLPRVADIEDAARLLQPHAVYTPLLESPRLNEELGARVLFKAEPLQRTGSFKFRGAFTAISRIASAQRAAGIIAFSSGNHAQGVAYSARLLDIPAVIVMPSTAPRVKIDNTRAYGAEVVLYDPTREDRETIGRRLASERGFTLVRPYDDFDVICGQGTIGLEIADQADALRTRIDTLLCPCGGGGLVGGIATALHARSPGTRVYSVEPEGFDDTRRSLLSGRRERNATGGESICDALLAPTPGALTFAVNRDALAGGLVASDTEAMTAMHRAFNDLKLVLEPGGAVALAAVLAGRFDVRGRTAVVVCSGGNVDPEFFARCLVHD